MIHSYNQKLCRNIKPPQKINPQRTQKKKNTEKAASNDLLEIIDNFLLKRQNRWFWVFFALSVLFTFLLFDLRVSVGGDDSLYIIRAYDFVKEFRYPSFQGPLYPIVLSVFVVIFGINLFVLKLLSAIFLTGHLYFLYKAFKGHIPTSILIVTIILLSINSYLLFYGSQTYAEAFFLMVQILFFVYFFKDFITDNEQIKTPKETIIRYVSLGAVVLCLGLIKSIGFASFFAVLIYFSFVKNWKAIAFSTGGFFAWFGLWQLIKLMVWGDNKAQFSDQASTLFQKHPYDPSQGLETFGGFIQRLIDNSNIYLSRQLFKVFGLRSELVRIDGALEAAPELPLLTILVYALLIVTFIWALRKNKFLLFTGIYLASIMGVSFFMLQPIWEGTRLIMVYFPLLVLYLIAGIYYLFKFKQLKPFQFIFPIIAIVLIFSSFNTSQKKIKKHQKVFKYHLRGNITAGMTPDWVHYINMCKWADKNVPEGKVIAARKPGIAFIYTGRRFDGIYKVTTQDADSLINYLYERKIEYVVMASLRKIEAQKTQYTINTIQRYLYYIQQKYPQKIKLVQQIGNNDDEPAYLFKIE